jgi:hypothetical protein
MFLSSQGTNHESSGVKMLLSVHIRRDMLIVVPEMAIHNRRWIRNHYYENPLTGHSSHVDSLAGFQTINVSLPSSRR